METSVKWVRTLQRIMLSTILLYVFVAARYGPPPKDTGSVFFAAITVIGFGIVAAIFVLRRVFTGSLEKTLAVNSEDSRALSLWRVSYLITYALCETVALLGVVLRFVGLTFSQVVPFFLSGFVLMLFYRPRRPSNAIG